MELLPPKTNPRGYGITRALRLAWGTVEKFQSTELPSTVEARKGTIVFRTPSLLEQVIGIRRCCFRYKNDLAHLPPASITKMLTLLIAAKRVAITLPAVPPVENTCIEQDSETSYTQCVAAYLQQ